MKKVLIIENDEGVRNVCITLLRREGYTVATLPISSGADELIKHFKPNVVLTDHNLGAGQEEGYTLAMRLKEQGVNVVLMSADPNIGSKAFESNLPFCQKPFSSKTLIKTIAEVDYA